MLSLPGLIIFICISGYLFNIYFGYFISTISITFGSLIFFLLSKFFFNNHFVNLFHKYTSNINRYISKSKTEYLIVFRMIPGPPLMVQNVILSLLDISILKFIISTFLGFSPLILFCVYIGTNINYIQSIKEISTKDIIFSRDFIFILLIIILIIFFRIKIKQK